MQYAIIEFLKYKKVKIQNKITKRHQDNQNTT